MIEVWKDIDGFEGLYQVSNLGRVKSLERYRRNNGNSLTKVNERYIKTRKLNSGYIGVSLVKDNVMYNKTVHRIVANSFILNQYNLPQVNHIDGNKENNCVDNLEWCTPSQNTLHSYETGLAKSGENNIHSKLTEIDVIEIRKLKGILSYREIGKKYNVHNTTISCIFNNKSWNHI